MKLTPLELRDYQLRAIEACRDVIRRKLLRTVLYSPTGSGKTVMGEAFIRSALNKGKRIGFVANRIGLVSQASDRFSASGIPHGIIQGDNTHSPHLALQVCSIQTIAKRGIPPVDMLVIDEAHGCPGSEAYRSLIARHNNLPIIGLTATPFARGMGKSHKELCGEPLFQTIVVAATIRELIEEGHLVDCEIYAPSEPDLSGVKMTTNAFGERDYDTKSLGQAVDKPALIGDIVQHWWRMAAGKPTVVFATNIAHSKHIVEQFIASGVKAEHMDCYTDDIDRKHILRRFDAGETTIISNVGILAEGWDAPHCEVMILARPTKSLIRWIQMAGRVLRPFPGKTRGLILDHSGSTHLLGYPTDDLPLELDDGSARKPGAAGEEEKEEPKPKKCPKCHLMKPPGKHTCPACGFTPERQNTVETEEGELKLVDRTKKSQLSMENKQAIYSQLLSLKNAKGYSDGWVSNQYRQIFGVWPKGMESICTEPSPEVRSYIKSQLIRYVKGKQAGEQRAA